MGYPKGKGARKCALCGFWYPVENMMEHRRRYYCRIDARAVRAAERARAILVGKGKGKGRHA